MEHSFDIDIAKEYGIESAIILKHIYFWVKKNKVCERHFHDGMYWTYSSVKAFKEMFPYMGEKKIRNAIQKLVDGGLILEGNYNEMPYDRTKWYALTERGFSLLEGNFGLSKRKLSFVETTTDICRKGEPIPDITTDIYTDIYSSNTNVLDCQTQNVRRCVEAWNSLQDIGVKPISRIAGGSKRYSSLLARIKEYGIEDVLSAIGKVRDSDFLQGKTKGRRHWVITFDWFVLPSNFPKVLEGNYDNDDNTLQQYTAPEADVGGWQ